MLSALFLYSAVTCHAREFRNLPGISSSSSSSSKSHHLDLEAPALFDLDEKESQIAHGRIHSHFPVKTKDVTFGL